jgi:4-coumarate--CoA ligase
VIVSEASVKNVIDACKELKFVEKIIQLDEVFSDHQATLIADFHFKYQNEDFNLKEIVKQPNNIYEQSAIIFLSSGTTGVPKGCELTQGNLFFTLGQYNSTLSTFKHFKRFNRTLNIAPWFHVIGFANMFMLIFSNQFSYVFLPKFTPQLFLHTLQNYKIANMMAPPPIVILLAKNPFVEHFDLSSLRLITCGGAPLTEEIENEIQTRFRGNLEIFQSFGMSETFTITAYHKLENPVRQSVGMILKGMHAKVIDKNGVSLGANEVGECCFKGPNIMKGYIDNKKATAETIDEDGWLHTGDLGYYDDKFHFFIVDRLKELIKYKAYQVAPAELEGLLLSHSKIKDAGVIGIPDAVAGELPMHSDLFLKKVFTLAKKSCPYFHTSLVSLDSKMSNVSCSAVRLSSLMEN